MTAVQVLDWPVSPEDHLPLALWTSGELVGATGGTASAAFEVSGVATDSREVREGDLFVALKGDAMDGHAFLDKAFANGAAAAVVDRPIPQPHLLAENTSSALELIAKAARNRGEAQFIGVTGSAGKTGVKEALFAALDRGSRGRAHRSLKSYNNHVGVPLSLSRMPARAKYGVLEMGMNHAGELAALTRIVRPHVAIVTTIAPAHIGFFSGEEAIADAKGEIFEGLTPGGTAIIPADSPHFERLREKALLHAAHVVSFGRAPEADVRVLDAIEAANGGTLVTAEMGARRICYTLSQPGEHWVRNSLAVMAAVRAVGGDLGAAGVALATMAGLPGRGARHTIAAKGGEALLIDESYNANPASMVATLAELGRTPASRRIAVLGAMRELGDRSDEYHAALAGPIREARIDQVVLVGDEMAALADELGKSAGDALHNPVSVAHAALTGEAAAALSALGLKAGDAILVKGSNSVGLSALIRSLTTG